MWYSWDETKRLANLKEHGVDFTDAEQVFDVRRIPLRTIGLPILSDDLYRLDYLKAYRCQYVTRKVRTLFISYHLDELLPVKRQSSSKKSGTNFRRLRQMKDRDIALSAEHPESEVKHIVRGIVRNGLRVVPPKESVSLRIDADVLKWFRAKGAGYQTRINAVLRAYKEAAR